MKTGAIRHPERAAIVIRREWQVRMINSSRDLQDQKKKDGLTDTAAELMSIFEFHYNNRTANRILKQEVDKFLKKNPVKSYPLGDWMPYTSKYLQELLLGGRSNKVVQPAIYLLESQKIISMDVPKDITDRFTQNAQWIKFNVDLVNEWIEDNCEKTWLAGWKELDAQRQTEKATSAIITEAVTDKIKEVTDIKKHSQMVDIICAFYKHIHNKTAGTIFDINRKAKVGSIVNRLRSAGLSDAEILGRCAQAIIGNVVSDYHQGRKPGQPKVYDSIDLIFRKAEQFENHVSYAVADNISEKMAYKEFEAFLHGKTSKYAKGRSTTSPEASNEQIEGIHTLPEQEQKRYREFARAIASFFASNIENKDILEFTKTNRSVLQIASGLTNTEAMFDALMHQIKIYKKEGIPDILSNQVRKFSEIYCKLEMTNE